MLLSIAVLSLQKCPVSHSAATDGQGIHWQRVHSPAMFPTSRTKLVPSSAWMSILILCLVAILDHVENMHLKPFEEAPPATPTLSALFPHQSLVWLKEWEKCGLWETH